VTVGEESAMHDHALLNAIVIYAEPVMESLLALAVALVSLALFTARRQRREYLWVFLTGALFALQMPFNLYGLAHNVSADSWMIYSLVNLGGNLAFNLIFQSFLRMRFHWLLWSVIIISLLLDTAADIALSYGSISVATYRIIDLPSEIVLSLLLPFLMLRQLRRGNREAGILLIPLSFFSINVYATYILALLDSIPAARAVGLHGARFINSFHVGIIFFSLQGFGQSSFWLSLAIIMVLRSNRMSRKQAQFEGELAAAQQVQQVILPEEMEPVPGFTVESVYQPAQEVGGDFFQILPTSEGGLLIVVGDVAGKGLPAAMLVSVLVGAIRTAAAYSQSPEEVLAQLNERLVGRTHGGFSTALVAHITADGWVTIANAGHLSPYLDGREVELKAALPLGILANVAYETTQFHLPHASRLTFYSDGVVEAQNPKGELFGFDRAKAISIQPAAAIVDAAIQFGQSDDITVVAIRRAESLATAA
jgi:phosphoserine phosphatase RsbU/P